MDELKFGMGHEFDYDPHEGRLRLLGGPVPKGFTRVASVDGQAGVENGFVDRIEYVSTKNPKIYRIVTGRRKTDTVVEQWMRNGKHYRAGDGPNEVIYRSDGTIAEERWVHSLSYGDRNYHRLDGPAHIVYFEDGTPRHELYYRKKKACRIDGPAAIDYRPDGTIDRALYSTAGEYHFESAYFYALLANDATDAHLKECFADTAFTEVAAGRERKVVRLFQEGIRTPEGVAEVFSGTPIEWVRAYEESRS